MPWVRIDENAMDHPKIGGLPDGAFRLWVQALAYCQKFLTDGAISAVALRGLRSFSPKRKTLLVEVGLWDETPTGISVHDFLDWNESREHVTAARKMARDRMQKLRVHRQCSSERSGERSPFVPSGVGVMKETPMLEVLERGTGKTDPHVRAGDFGGWYEDTHQRILGVGYMGTNADYTKILQLVGKFTDAELQDAALVWFGADDDFATQGTRSIGKFASRVSGYLQQIKARGIA